MSIEDSPVLEDRLNKLESRLAQLELKLRLSGDRPRRPIELTDAICSSCGKDCKIPFKPTTDRPIFCKVCWQERKGRR